jgi:hypothetical protein
MKWCECLKREVENCDCPAAPPAPVGDVGELVKRLLSNEPLPICPFDRRSPEYFTTREDEPCKFCGQENTAEGSDKCRGADTRLLKEAADALTALSAMLAECERERKRWEYLADCAWKQGDVDAWARLCDAQNWPRIDTVNEMKQVVDERDAAEARVEALETALKPFADIAQSIEEHCYDIASVATRDLFAARAALSNKGEG